MLCKNYDASTLQTFNGIFRHSQVTGLIDDVDDSILSNITTVKLSQNITPTLNVNTKYELEFNNAIYNPHTGHAHQKVVFYHPQVLRLLETIMRCF